MLDVYSTIGWVAVGIGVALILISPLIKRMMHLDTLAEDMARYNEKQGLTNDLTLEGEAMAGERMSPAGDVKG